MQNTKNTMHRLVFKVLIILAIFGMQTTNAQTNSAKFEKIKELGGIEEYSYTPNGLNILLLQDNSIPVVTVQVVYRVGSKHEVPGNTGSTHLLEHLNFKGTPTFNKKNDNSIDKVLSAVGAQMNATTWYDRTNYYETIPSDKIALAIEIEADRMRNSLLLKEDKDSEMTVVRNEFERGENSPNQVLNKKLWSAAYEAHPYHHNTIGWKSDIENMPIEALRKFYDAYYWPNNATLTIVGDFEKENLFQLVDTYFGKITTSPNDIPQPYTTEPEQLGPKRVVVKRPGEQAIVSIGYKIPGKLHEDSPALEVLGEVIGRGTSSIINKNLIDTGDALYGYVSASSYQDAGLFNIALGFSPDKEHEKLNNKMLTLIEKIKKEGVSQSDIDRIISKNIAQTILDRDGSANISSGLTEAIAVGDWTDYVTGAEKLSKVTAEDVKRVANQYLLEDQSTTGYFIPQGSSPQMESSEGPTNFVPQETGKYYYRSPAVLETKKIVNEGPSDIIEKEKYVRKTVAGIDVVTVKTAAKGFITVSASLPISQYLGLGKNSEVPSLTAQMLSKGTTKNDKFQFSEKLEKLGVDIGVYTEGHNVNIVFTCLKKDVQTVIDMLAEELRYPLFDQKEFDLLKEQNIGFTKTYQNNPEALGAIALAQAIYPKGHPNYSVDLKTTIKDLERATISDLKDFHKTYFGTAGMHLVAVGDIDATILYAALAKAFKGWTGGVKTPANYTEPQTTKSSTKVITVPEKPSAQLMIGQYTGVKRMDDDFMPLDIGTRILGDGFSGRLMQTVRDQKGLTYGIYADHSGHSKTGGHLEVAATFSPSLFQQGLDATMIEIKKWVKDGVTAKELEAKKSNLTGSFKVGLATSYGLAGAIRSFIERGQEPSYIDQYPKDVDNVTLKQVNKAIKKYMDVENMVIIKSGSLDANGKPIEE